MDYTQGIYTHMAYLRSGKFEHAKVNVEVLLGEDVHTLTLAREDTLETLVDRVRSISGVSDRRIRLKARLGSDGVDMRAVVKQPEHHTH